MRYQVRAVREGTGTVSLEMEAADVVEATRLAEAQGLVVLSVDAVKGLGLRLFRQGGQFDVVLFSQELLALLNAGINVVEALEALHEKEKESERGRLLGELLSYLKEGLPLSAAMQRMGAVFPPLYVATVRASEKTGGLPEGLSRYVAYAGQVNTVKKKFLTASIYPTLLFVVGGLVMVFLLGYVVPRFGRIYEDMGTNLPFLSRLLLQWGQFVEAHGMLVLGVVVGGLASAAYALSRPEVRQAIVDRIYRLPALRERLRIYQLARFYRTLGMLLRGGIPVTAAMDMASGLLQPQLRSGMEAAARSIREGGSISETFHREGLTTPVALRLLRAGERGGGMGEMMEHTAAFYDEEIGRWVEWATRLFEPLLMVFIGLIIGVIVVLMYMPIFDLAGGL